MVRKKYSPKEIAGAAFCLLAAILILTLYIWHLTENIRLGYEIKKLEGQVSSLREDVNQLEVRKTTLLALDRVERIAREELKMADPKDGQIIYEDFQPEP
ncbi:MAG: cell division protein FtsL [Candidatus Aminicenantales bacterium]